MKLALVLLLLCTPAFADPRLRGELDALGRRIAAAQKLDYAKDKQAASTLQKVAGDLDAFRARFDKAYKAALPRQARLRELADELMFATDAGDQAKIAALEAEQKQLEAEVAKAPKAERDKAAAWSALYRDLTKQRFELLSEQRRALEAQLGTPKK